MAQDFEIEQARLIALAMHDPSRLWADEADKRTSEQIIAAAREAAERGWR